jgi:trk system potassium uptake protein TrkH
MGEEFSSLVQAVRWRVLGKYLGQLALVLAVLVLPPLAVALIANEHAAVPRYLVTMATLCAFGWPLSRLDAPDRLQGNEAVVIVTLAFVLAPLLMAYPMSAAGLSYMDALFEAVSGITTTGLTTLARVEDKPGSFLFLRAWMQWYGGLGIAVLAVALLAHQGLAARKLVESSGTEILVSTSRIHARRVLTVYVLLTLAAFLLIWAAGLPPFAALEHALAAVSTGGFSSFDASLGGDLPPLVPYAVVLAAFLGAVSLPTYYAAARHGLTALWADYELRALVVACGATGLLLTLWFDLHGMGLAQSVHHGMLLAVSGQTTAGFSTLQPANLDDLPKAVLILAMWVGGSEGSTAGGAKLFRLLILMRLVQLAVRRASLPEHAVVEGRLGGRPVDDAELVRAMLIMALFWGVVLLSWLVFLAYSYRPLDALFEVVSATATVGLSAGVTTVGLPTPLKLLLCADMLAGRLEIMALLITLYPPTWFGRR